MASMDFYSTLRARREEILRLAARHGATDVRVFGSVARGETLEESDVDFLVELEPGRSLLDHAALVIDLQDLLARHVDVATIRGLCQDLRDRILAEAIPL